MSETKVKTTRDLSLPDRMGTYFRILCMTGKNKGVAYFIDGSRLVMGRSQKADIQVLDEKSSREHGELVRNGGTYILTDLKSSNGITVNDIKIVQKKLSDKDKIVIGKVVFRFDIIKVTPRNQLLKKDHDEDNNENEIQSGNKNKKLMIYGVAFLGLLFFLFKEEPERKPASTSSQADAVNDGLIGVVEEYNKNQRDEKGMINEGYVHRGQREFRERNYFRAIEEFNMALVLDPSDADAGFYLNKTKQALNNHIKFMFEKGGREYGQLKYSGAIKSYCEIVKLLQKYPEDERYKDAKDQVIVVGKKMGINEDEYRCWEDNPGEN